MSSNLNDPTQRAEPRGAENESSAGAQSKTSETNLSEEFREFGRHLTTLLRTARESPRVREIEQDVTQAMRDMEHQVNDALSKARDKTQPQNVKETIVGTAAYAAEETQRGLTRGLRSINERLAKAAQEAERNRATATPTPETAGETSPVEVSEDPTQAGDEGL